MSFLWTLTASVENLLHNQFTPRRSFSRRVSIPYRQVFEQPQAETLESRTMMSAVDLTAREQLLLELINRARMDPGAEAARYEIDLNQGLNPGTISDTAKPALAPNQALLNAARSHSDDMLARDYFDHDSPEGTTPGSRASSAGYSNYNIVGENISWGGSTGQIDEDAHVYERHRRLFLSSGHRTNMLDDRHREVGTGVRYGLYTDDGTTYNASMVTELFGGKFYTDNFITGVAFTDATSGADNDDFYTIGEAFGGGTVRATNVASGAEYSDMVGTAGGYSLQVPDGTYNVTMTGPNGDVTYIVTNVVVNGENVKVDFETTTATVQEETRDPTQLGLVGFVNGNWWMADTEADGEYSNHVAASGPANTFQKVVQGDFNGDNIEDVAVWLNSGEWQVGISNGQGQFNFSAWTTWTHPAIKEVHVGDFNDDGRDDIIGLFKSGNRGRWWVATSTGQQFLNRHWGDYGNYDGINTVLAGNFDGLKGDDLAVVASSGVVWMVKTSNTRFQYLNSHRWTLSNGFEFAQVGNFNGDTRDDILAVFGTGRNRSIFVAKSLGPADGFYSSNWTNLTVTQSLDAVAVGDFDGDGRDNVATLLNGTKLWYGESDGRSFSMRFGMTWSQVGQGMDDLAVGDSNGDGLADIVARADNGYWYAAESTGSSFSNYPLVRWAPNASWGHVMIGSFLSPVNPPQAVAEAPTTGTFSSSEDEVFGDPALLDLLQNV